MQLMHPSSFVGPVARDVQMLKQAIDAGKAAGASQTLLAEAERLSLGPRKPAWDGQAVRQSGRKD